MRGEFQAINRATLKTKVCIGIGSKLRFKPLSRQYMCWIYPSHDTKSYLIFRICPMISNNEVKKWRSLPGLTK